MNTANDAREAYMAIPEEKRPDPLFFGYDAARAEFERKVAELEEQHARDVDSLARAVSNEDKQCIRAGKAEAQVRELDFDRRELADHRQAEIEALRREIRLGAVYADLATERTARSTFKRMAANLEQAYHDERERNAALDIRRREGRQLLRRFIKYAREDRATTDGSTRLERLTAQVDDYLTRTEDPNDVLRAALAAAPVTETGHVLTPEQHAGIGAGGGDDDVDHGETWRESAITEGKAKLRAEKKCRAVEAVLREALPDTLPQSSSREAITRALVVLNGDEPPPPPRAECSAEERAQLQAVVERVSEYADRMAKHGDRSWANELLWILHMGNGALSATPPDAAKAEP